MNNRMYISGAISGRNYDNDEVQIFSTARDFCRFCQNFEGELRITKTNEIVFDNKVIAIYKKNEIQS